MKSLHDILSADIFQKIMNNEVLQMAQLNAAISLLIKGGIPFDLSFSPGTRRIAPQASLTVYINPTTTMGFIIPFDAGAIIF